MEEGSMKIPSVRQKGQTLVLVALALVALLLILALAIDIGLLHLERRHMQNAADAGALAGARELCLGHGNAAAEAKALEYATVHNRAQQATVAIQGNKVTVVASKPAELFFGGITGIPTVNISADATAACGGATVVCGLWPIAFLRGAFNELKCDQTFYVWDDDKTLVCNMDDCPADDPDCTYYDCDLDDDGIDDIIRGGDRSWLDLSGAGGAYGNACLQPGCGTNEIRCLILNNSGTKIRLPYCISGDSGVRAGVANAVRERVGAPVAIPLYDSVGCEDPSGNCPGGTGYWVTTVGCVIVEGWVQNLRLEPQPTPIPPPVPPGEPTPTPTPKTPGGSPPIIGKAIQVRLDCDDSCMSACGSTGGSPGLPWEYLAVSLIE